MIKPTVTQSTFLTAPSFHLMRDHMFVINEIRTLCNVAEISELWLVLF